MSVRRVELRGFTVHAGTVVDLPERGVVLVTGANGSGKSSILEAISWALWGRTLRGADPWQGDAACEAVVLFSDGTRVSRRREKGRTVLAFCQLGEDHPAYESATKAQDALERLVGQHDAWRRTSVFSSQDAAGFSSATDGERKRLLESVLGLDRFDGALDRCRGDLRAASSELARARSERASAAARLDAARQALERATEAGNFTPPTARGSRTPGQATQAEAALRGAEGDLTGLRARIGALERAGGEGDAAARAAERRLARLGEGACDACGQPVPDALRARLAREAQAARSQADAERASRAKDLDDARCDLAELVAEAHDLRARQEALARAEAQVAAQERARAAMDRLRASSEVVVARAAEAVERLAAVEATLAGREALLTACEGVLGLRGVRAQVLGRALSGVEAAANRWLALVAGPGLRLRLAASTERKSGATSDAISLAIEGAGGGGYRGSSGGERRRIDVALLLALAEVAGAARGEAPGTLFLDEVFDSLDAAGCEAVGAALEELAERRCVLVISHSAEVARALRPALRLRCDGGRVEAA